MTCLLCATELDGLSILLEQKVHPSCPPPHPDAALMIALEGVSAAITYLADVLNDPRRDHQ